MTKQEKIQTNINVQSVAALKKMATELSQRFEGGADYVFELVLDVLQSKMDAQEFVLFSEAIYA